MYDGRAELTSRYRIIVLSTLAMEDSFTNRCFMASSLPGTSPPIPIQNEEPLRFTYRYTFLKEKFEELKNDRAFPILAQRLHTLTTIRMRITLAGSRLKHERKESLADDGCSSRSKEERKCLELANGFATY